jgi:hypothetical protein
VGEHVVQAWIAAGFVLEGEYTVHDQGQGYRLVLRTGSGAIEGRVFGRDGQPCADARVTLRAQVQGAHPLVRWTQSDVLGRYRFERQPASFCILRSAQGDVPCDVLGGRARFVLEEGATHAVDLGSEQPPASWVGTLCAADGTRGPIATRLSFDEVGRGTQIDARTDDTGAFQVELPPGTWAVRSLALASGVEIDRAVVGAAPLGRDFVVPGPVVIVTAAPREGAGGTLVLTELGGARIERPLHRSGDAHVAVLPAPGRHRLTAHPPDAFVEIPREGSIVDVEPGASLVRIEVTTREAVSR